MISAIVVFWLLQAASPAAPQSAPACPNEMLKVTWLQPIYPPEAVRKGFDGAVELHALVDAEGKVKRVVEQSGDPLLSKAAAEQLKGWRFTPCEVDGKPSDVDVPVRFEFHSETWSVTSTSQQPRPLAPGKPPRVRANQGVVSRNIRYQVKPIYPPEARAQGIQGSVILHVIIGRDGGVQILGTVVGDPTLAAAARHAVGQWRYTPYYLGGEPVEVDTTIEIAFNLR